MSIFRYSYTQNNKQKKALLSADTRKDCVMELAYRGIAGSQIEELFSLGIAEKHLFRARKVKKPNTKVLIHFFEQMAFLLGSDIPLYSGIEILSKSKAKPVKTLCLRLLPDLLNGATLDDSMRKSQMFSESMIQQVSAGVQSGNLVECLKRIAEYLKKNKEMKGKIISVMVYPLVTLVVMITALLIMMIFVIPPMAETITSLGGELPAITKGVIAISRFVSAEIFYIMLLIATIPTIFNLLCKQFKKLRYLADKFSYSIPIVGEIRQKIDINNFCLDLYSMLLSGIALVKALQISIETCRNEYLKDIITKVTQSVEKDGLDIYLAFNKYGKMPDVFLQLLSVGVNSGNMVGVLKNLSQYYESEVTLAVKTITSLIEPLIMVIICVGGGVIAVAMYLPMISIVDIL